jgi:hypothetical protein
LLYAAPALRPSYLAGDVGGLLIPQLAPRMTDRSAQCGRWRVSCSPADPAGPALLQLEVDGDLAAQPSDDAPSGGVPADYLDALRALCAAAWSARDGRAGETDLRLEAGSAQAAAVLEQFALAS